MKRLLICLAGLGLIPFAFAQTTPSFSYKLLKESRAELAFPEYTLAEKNIVLSQAYLTLEQIFAHRELKLEAFGQQTDPLPQIKKLQENVEALSTTDLHLSMTNIFLQMRDRHTTYAYPMPVACYRSLLPVSFKTVMKDGAPIVAVSAVSEINDILALVPNLPIRTGDELLTYNGKPASEALKDNFFNAMGANDAATLRRANALLSVVGHKTLPPSKEDVVTMTFKSRLGKFYEVTLPWIVRADLKCLTPVSELDGSDMGVDDYQVEYNRIFRQSKKSKNKSLLLDGLKDTAEPILKYKVVKNDLGDYLLLWLESFMPEKLTVEELVDEVKKLLIKYENTDGVIFDVRDNGGGRIALAHKLVELFTPKNPVPQLFRLKNSLANRHYMNVSAPNDSFTIALTEAERTGVTSVVLPLYEPEMLDQIGQFWFKPVAIFTNSNCYSSCDMLSALLQDHAAAIVIGEDSTTGAGGANNFMHRDIVKQLKEDLGPFVKLPGSQDFVFSFRQTIRSGLNAGKLIENIGVLSDIMAPTTYSDLFTDSGDQFRVIARALNERAPLYSSWVKMADSRQDYLDGAEMSAQIKWENTNFLRIKAAGHVVSESEVELSNPQGTNITFPRVNTGRTGEVEILGERDGARVWRKRHRYRIVPATVAIEAPRAIALSELAIFNYNLAVDNGWTIKEGVLASNKGEEYSDQTNAMASLFATLPAEKLKLNFEASVETEQDFDFFRVKLVVDGKVIVLEAGLSGSIAEKTFSYDLSEYAGKSVEIRLIFVSDTGLQDNGVRIQNIRLEAN